MGQKGDTFTYNGKVIENYGPDPTIAKLTLIEILHIVSLRKGTVILVDHNWQTLYNHVVGAKVLYNHVVGAKVNGAGFRYHGPVESAPDTVPAVPKAKPKPVLCKKCNMQNDFGEPNQKDGTYVCYNCR